MTTKANETKLNDKELKLVAILSRDGKSTITKMARAAFPGVRPFEKAKSWVRNSLRKLVATRTAKKVGRGTYTVC